jgi:hypothetical protein
MWAVTEEKVVLMSGMSGMAGWLDGWMVDETFATKLPSFQAPLIGPADR